MAKHWLAPAFALTTLLVAAGHVSAKNEDYVLSFSTDPAVAGTKTNLEVRPNTGQTYYLWIRNKTDDLRDVTVQIVTADGKQILAEAKIQKLPKENPNKPEPVRVMLVKPAPPMPPAAAVTPAAATAPAPMPMGPPPPPGIELKLGDNADKSRREFTFRIHVRDDQNVKQPTVDIPMVVGIRRPADYVKPVDITFRRETNKMTQRSENQLSAEFKAEGLEGETPCPVELTFPPQKGIKVTALREGQFRRVLTAASGTAKLYTRNIPLLDSTEPGEFHINVDGVRRAFVYRHSFADTEGKSVKVDQLPMSAIRFMEGEQLAPPETVLLTRPRVLPLRVEADSSVANATIDIIIKQLPQGQEIETLTRAEKLERRAYLDAGAMDGSILVTTRVNDWTIPVDLKDLRGRYLLQASLRNPAEIEKPIATFERPLVVDDTKPEEVKIEVLPTGVKEKDGTIRHLKTKPVPVRVRVEDPESGIKKVIVFFGKVGPDGKMPEAFVLAKQPNAKLDPDVWEAMLPLPAEPPAPPPVPGAPPMPPAPPKTPDVTAIAVNGVDIASDPVSVRIQLIDPPTGGTIKGVVAMGPIGKGIEGVTVLLLNSDKKEVGSAKTKAGGKFTMENVAPGAYRLAAARPDSGVGTKGDAPVRVEAGQVTEEVRVILTRKP